MLPLIELLIDATADVGVPLAKELAIGKPLLSVEMLVGVDIEGMPGVEEPPREMLRVGVLAAAELAMMLNIDNRLLWLFGGRTEPLGVADPVAV